MKTLPRSLTAHADIWEVIRARNGVQAACSVLVRVAVRLVIFGAAAAETEALRGRFKSIVSNELAVDIRQKDIKQKTNEEKKVKATHCCMKLAPYPPNVHCAPFG